MKEKEYKITINHETFNLTWSEIKTLLTETAFKFFNRVHRQGGEIRFGKGSIKDEFKPQFETT